MCPRLALIQRRARGRARRRKTTERDKALQTGDYRKRERVAELTVTLSPLLRRVENEGRGRNTQKKNLKSDGERGLRNRRKKISVQKTKQITRRELSDRKPYKTPKQDKKLDTAAKRTRTRTGNETGANCSQTWTRPIRKTEAYTDQTRPTDGVLVRPKPIPTMTIRKQIKNQNPNRQKRPEPQITNTKNKNKLN